MGRILLQATGSNAQALVGQHLIDLSYPSRSQAPQEGIQCALSSAAAGNTVRQEVVLRAADGLPVSVEMEFSPVCDADGRVVAIAATGTDSSATQETEAALRRSHRGLVFFRRLLDRTNDLVYLADAATGRLIDTNETTVKKLGYSREQLLRMRVTDFAGAVSSHTWFKRVEAVQRAGSLVMEETYHGKSDRPFPVETSLSYVEHPMRPLVIAVARDISERRAHEEQIADLTRVLRMQSSINSAVLRLQDRDELLREVCRVATDVGGYEHAVLLTVDADGHHARASFASGTELSEDDSRPIELNDDSEPDTSLTSRALRTGELTACDDLTELHTPIARRERLIQLGARSAVVLPLIVAGRRVGALLLASNRVNRVLGDEILLLQEIRSSLEMALGLQERRAAGRYHTYFDPLTGLANRSLLCERLESKLRDRTSPDPGFMVAAFDIHGLTSINDSFGRRIGDLVLQRIAERLRNTTNGEDRLGYLGSGTFILVEPGSSASAENLAALLHSGIFGDAFEIDGQQLHVSCRSGMARYPLDGDCADALIQHAEAALKRAKDTDEQYLYYELHMYGETAERLALEHELRAALENQQLVLHYQPQINIKTGKLDSVEALLRWKHPDRGLIPPGSFLPVLEGSGAIVPVGTWVLERAVSDCARLCSLGLGPVRVAVNVSAIQLRRRDFVESVLQIAKGLPETGCGLDLEITETCLLQDLDTVSRKLRALRTAGLRIALDDFGTGYASLGLLSKLPLDLLKIDRSFIQGLGTDPKSAALVSSILQLAKAFELPTIAEGVETLEQLVQLERLNCTYAQGYFHSPPVPIEDIEKLMRAEARRSMAYAGSGTRD